MSIGSSSFEPTNSQVIFSNGWGTTPVTMSYGFTSDSGVQAEVKVAKTPEGISPSLYIKYVKSKFTKVQKEQLQKRLNKLKKLIPYAKDMGQQALYEELTKELYVILKESEAEALDCGTYVKQESVDKFISSVKDRVIKFDDFENFPRVVPRKVQTKFKKLQATNVFDNFKILYIDYTKDAIKTTSEKIRNKDPILFGQFKIQPDRLYYIADWVDEHCDLTLDKFIEKMKVDDPEFSIEEVPEVTEDLFDNIKKEVMERHQRLQDTNSSNWREKVREEERKKLRESAANHQKVHDLVNKDKKDKPKWYHKLGIGRSKPSTNG